MKLIKPKALKKGDVVGVCSPASPLKSRSTLTKGINYLEELGYRVELGKHIFGEYGYLAGEDAHRAQDFNSMVSNKKIKGIFFTRGGFGSSRILPLIDFENLKRNPKIIVGYSDVTALQLAIFRETGMVTFAGPMVASDFGQKFSGVAEGLFWEMLTSTKPIGNISKYFSNKMEKISAGKAVGRLIGGNLSIICSMVGTKYLPSMDNAILMLEDVEEAPYRVDRMLHQLKYAGVLEILSGILLGDFSSCKPVNNNPSLTLGQIFDNLLKNQPTISNLHFGHVKNPITLPQGVRVKINTQKKEINILESVVI
jgi:muramoyltetrapeptide carboxypeptidase